MTALLAGYPVVVELPVQWGDQDAFGHVNNVVFFRWFESARIAYFNRPGLSHLCNPQQTGLILASIKCDYRRPLVYPDRVLIGARVASIGRSSMNMEHELASEEQGCIAAAGQSVVVTYDYTAGRPARVPPEVRQTIEQLEGRSFPVSSD